MHCTRKNKREPRAFTFIEMIMVVSLLSLVSLAIYTTFNNGLRIWYRINAQLFEEDVNILFDRFARDVKNSCRFSGMHFLGSPDKLELVTLLDSPRMAKHTVGVVIYFYSEQSEILNREERDFSQVYNNDNGRVMQSLKNIVSLKFQYYAYDSEKKQYVWLDEWLDDSLPLAVRMELEFDHGAGTDKFSKTVSIPISS